MRSFPSLETFLALCCVTASASASLTPIAYWKMDDTGSNPNPVDNLNGYNFTGQFGTSAAGTGTAAQGSTGYLDFNPMGHWDPKKSGAPIPVPTDNYVFEIWFRVAAADLGRAQPLIRMGPATNAPSLVMNDGGSGLRASLNGTAYVGEPMPVTADTWHHVAWIMLNGTSHIYFDGVEHATTTSTPNPSASIHLGINPGGGGNRWIGGVDDFRYSTVDPAKFIKEDLLYYKTSPSGPVRFYNEGASASFPAAALSSDRESWFRLGGAANDLVTVNDADALSVVPGTAPAHLIHITREGAVAPGDYTLIDYSGTIGGLGATGFALAPLPAGMQATLVDNPAESRIELHVTADGDTLVWTGDETNGSLWDVGLTNNWAAYSTSADSPFIDGSEILFNNGGVVSDITVSGTVAPSRFTIDTILPENGGKTYGFSGDPIASTGSFVKNGEGTAIFKNNVSFSGSASIQGGTLTVGDGTSGNLSAASIGVDEGATLELNLPEGANFSQPIANAGTLNPSGTGSLTLSGQVTGTGGILVSRAGDVRITGNGNTGAITVADGSNLIAAGGAWASSFFGAGTRSIHLLTGSSLTTGVHSLGGLGATFNQPLITIDAGATWFLQAEHYFTPSNLILNGGRISASANGLHLFAGTLTVPQEGTGSIIENGRVNLFGDLTFDVAFGVPGADLRILSPLQYNGSASYGITKTGPGTLVLGGGGSYTGPTLVNEGGLTVNGALTATSITAATGTTVGGNGSTAGALTIQSGATLSPGESSIGSFSAASATLAGIFRAEIDTTAPAGIDRLDVAGALDLTGSTLDLIQTGSAVVAGKAYTLATFGSLTGAFTTVNNLPPGFSLHYGDHAILLISDTPDAYTTWSYLTHELAGEAALPDSDSDGDDMNNALEFVLAADPKQPDGTKLPAMEIDDGNFLFSYRLNPAASVAVVSAEVSTDLVEWTPAQNDGTTTVQTIPNGSGSGIDRVDVTSPLPAEGRAFARLRVFLP